MAKFVLFYIVWMLTRSPLIAIAVIIAFYYFIDKRYFGFSPRLTQTFRPACDEGRQGFKRTKRADERGEDKSS